MNKRSTKTVAELEQEKFQSVFAKLLQDEENKYCADCSRKQPRWASWNLGVFLCIRCAGIHRNLGVHISKVKSINLDKWTAEQVQNMLAMGNSKGKTVYEATLSDNYIRSQNDAALEVFIRQKYEHKKYILKNWKGINEEAKDLAVAQSLSEIPNGVQQVSPKTMNTKHIKEDVCLIDFSDSTIQSSKATSNTSWDDMLSDFATAPEFNSKTINSNNINLDTINSNIITSIPPPPGNSDKTINAKSNDILPLFNLPITPSQNLGMNNHIQNVGTNNHLQHLGMNNHIQNFGMNGGATGQNFSSFMSRPTHCQNEIRLPVKQTPTRYDPFADLVCFGGNTSPVVNTKSASNKFETPKVITSAFDPFKDPFNKPVLSAPNIEFSDLLGNGSTVKSDSNGNPNKSTDICSDLDFLQF